MHRRGDYDRAVIIRRAGEADAASLAEFAARVFVETFGPDNTAADVDAYVAKTYGVALQTREIADPHIVTLLVEEEGTLIGFAQMRIDRDAVEIARFYVDRAWHGRGVAQRLMDACCAIARDLAVARIWLGVWERNARAIAFYEKCGFRDIGSQPFLLGTDLQTDRVMELQITTPSLRATHREG